MFVIVEWILCWSFGLFRSLVSLLVFRHHFLSLPRYIGLSCTVFYMRVFLLPYVGVFVCGIVKLCESTVNICWWCYCIYVITICVQKLVWHGPPNASEKRPRLKTHIKWHIRARPTTTIQKKKQWKELQIRRQSDKDKETEKTPNQLPKDVSVEL